MNESLNALKACLFLLISLACIGIGIVALALIVAMTINGVQWVTSL